jgi:hypothetical protein
MRAIYIHVPDGYTFYYVCMGLSDCWSRALILPFNTPLNGNTLDVRLISSPESKPVSVPNL